MIAALILAAGAGMTPVPPALAGHTAGAPVECVPDEATRNPDRYDGAMVFKGRGGPWLQSFEHRCPQLTAETTPVFERLHGPNLCRGDIVRVVQRGFGGGSVGACALGPFVPYR